MALPGWVTDEVLSLLGPLTPKQRQGIVRIVEAEIAGVRLKTLFEAKDRICTETTYYRSKPPGWHRQERFRQALKAARDAAWSFSMETAVEEAVRILTVSAPAAARELQRQIEHGDKDADRRDASKSVLDRVDVETASKNMTAATVAMDDMSDLDNDELDARLAHLFDQARKRGAAQAGRGEAPAEGAEGS